MTLLDAARSRGRGVIWVEEGTHDHHHATSPRSFPKSIPRSMNHGFHLQRRPDAGSGDEFYVKRHPSLDFRSI